MTEIRIVNSDGDASLHEIDIRDCISQEKANQIIKWGQQDHMDFRWLSILMKEIGELSECINQMNTADNRLGSEIVIQKMQIAGRRMEHELIQTAAVIETWLECVRRRRLIHQQQQKKEPGPGDDGKGSQKPGGKPGP